MQGEFMASFVDLAEMKKQSEYVEKINPDMSKLAPLPSLSDFEAAEAAAAAAKE